MNKLIKSVFIIALSLVSLVALVYAGRVVESTDFKRHEVIFNWADAKLVSFEFIADNEKGKLEATKLHNHFLENIQGLPGAAIITFKTPEGESIKNYRVHAEEVAKKQNAQMALWGSLTVDKENNTFINARLSLLDLPRGIETKITKPDMRIRGRLIDKPTQKRIDFRTVKGDALPIAEFASGLVYYYKGSTLEVPRVKRVNRLTKAIIHFQNFLNQTNSKDDARSSAIAYLFIARSEYMVAILRPLQRRKGLEKALEHASKSVQLNPYEADAFTVQAIIKTTMKDHSNDTSEVQALLKKSARLSPTSPDVKANLSLFQASEGKFDDAIQQIEQIEFLQSQQKSVPVFPRIRQLKDKLIRGRIKD